MRSILLLFGLISAVPCHAGDAAGVPPPFAVVLIDRRTEEALGPFPYVRAIYAKTLESLSNSGARGVVLKFFIDQPKET